jgi:hypothetical protein
MARGNPCIVDKLNGVETKPGLVQTKFTGLVEIYFQGFKFI